MSISQLFSIIRARWKIVLFVLLGVVSFVLIVSLVWPKQYIASSTLVINSNSPDPINGMVMPGGLMPSYIATQMEVIQSERVARGVINSLGMNKNSDMVKQWRDATNGQGQFEAWLSELLQKNLVVSPSRESSVLTISYKGVDPNFAAAMANAFANAYIATTLELRVEPARRFSDLFTTQIKQGRDELERAQARLSAYQNEKGIIATEERLDVESERLSALSNQYIMMQAQSADSSGRRSRASSNSAEVLNNPVVAGLKADLARQEARLKELSASLGEAHPQVLQLRANIGELQSRIGAEVSRVTSSVGINNSVDLSREAQIKAALEAQRDKVLKLKQQRNEASVLLADVNNAQRSYEALQVRFSQSSLESQSNQTNVSVLKVASPPSEAAFPRPILNTIISVVLGLLLGIGSALIREIFDRRMRSDNDFVEGLSVPLLGSIPRALPVVKKHGLLSGESSKLPFRGLPELSAPPNA